MAGNIINGLAIVLGVVATVPILEGMFKSKPDDSKTTTVRIIAGDGDTMDGNQPGIHLFDRSGNTITLDTPFEGPKINRGEPRDLNLQQIEPVTAANGAEYISLTSAGNDGICISIITVTTPTGIIYSWMGDIAAQCDTAFADLDIPWFYGNVVVSSGEKGVVTPKCVWIDGDGTNGIRTKGLGIHLPSFIPSAQREEDFRNNPAKMCRSAPRFQAYSELSVLDSLPYFMEPVFDNALMDFGDKALDAANWGQREPFNPLAGRSIGNSTAFEADLVEADADDENYMQPRQAATGNRNDRPEGNQRKTGPAKNSQPNGIKSGSKNAKQPQPQPQPQSQKTSKAGNSPAGSSSGSSNNRAGVKQRPWRSPGQLIKATRPSHSAKQLCESSSSWGPDLVNEKEGYYCHMDTKMVWELCKSDSQAACFDIKTNKMRLGKGNSRRDETSGRRIPRPSYTLVKEW